MLPAEQRMTDERTLYVGTDHALYRARPDDDGRWRAEGVALAGLGGVRGLVVDPGDPRHWWACTADNGILATGDEGITWRAASAGITATAGWCLVRHPRTGELWHGAAPVSVFRSADGGESWTECEGVGALRETPDGDAQPPPRSGHVRRVAFGPKGLVLVTVDGGWLLRSDDGGATWAVARDGLDRDCHAAAIAPGEPDTLLVATGAGVFRSDDAGRSFAPSGDGLRHRYVVDVVVHPDRPEVVFAAAAECGPEASAARPEGADGAFYRSDDGGRAWWRLTGGLPEMMRAAPTCAAGDAVDPDSFYVGMTDGSVWLSEDGGESFAIAVEGIQGWVRHLLVTRR
jgi:photosystem II stability/assembly factor-like uncharacterized protein